VFEVHAFLCVCQLHACVRVCETGTGARVSKKQISKCTQMCAGMHACKVCAVGVRVGETRGSHYLVLLGLVPVCQRPARAFYLEPAVLCMLAAFSKPAVLCVRNRSRAPVMITAAGRSLPAALPCKSRDPANSEWPPNAALTMRPFWRRCARTAPHECMR